MWAVLSGGDPSFYATVFGWSCADGVFTLDGTPVAGCGAPSPVGPAWIPYASVPDPAAITIAGGRVLAPGVVADPWGAVFGVRRQGGRESAGVWAEVCVPDPDGAREFYAGVLGWTPHGITMALPDGDVPYTVFVDGGLEQAGVMPLGGSFPPGPARWLTYVEVADCDAVVRAAGEAGGAVVVPAFDIPRIGRVAVLAGRSGETFALLQIPAT